MAKNKQWQSPQSRGTKRRTRLVKTYATVFNSKEGRDVLFDMITSSGFMLENNPSVQQDIYGRGYEHGLRDFVLRIINMSNMDILSLNKEFQDYERRCADARDRDTDRR